MAEEGVPLIKVLEDIVDDRKFIICQASSSEPTSTTENVYGKQLQSEKTVLVRDSS